MPLKGTKKFSVDNVLLIVKMNVGISMLFRQFLQKQLNHIF